MNLDDQSDVKCPKCDETGGEVECEVCLLWFHPECVGLSVLKPEALKQYNFHWFCQDCEAAACELHSK